MGIESELCSLKYTSVAAAVRKLRGRPLGASLAKFDTANAYRNLPVHLDDRPGPTGDVLEGEPVCRHGHLGHSYHPPKEGPTSHMC